MDAKRFFLMLSYKWYTVIAALLLGAVLFGLGYGVHYGYETRNPKYTTEGIFYISAKNPQGYVYYNGYTWEDQIKKEIILEPSYQALCTAHPDTTITKEEMRESVSATILSDLRIVVVTITSDTEEKCALISEAFSVGITGFAEHVREFNSIDFWGYEEIVPVEKENLILHAILLGMVTGFIVWLVVYLMYYAVEDSIVTHKDVEALGLFFVGFESVKENEHLKKQVSENCHRLFGTTTPVRVNVDQIELWHNKMEEAGENGLLLEVPFRKQNLKKVELCMKNCKDCDVVVKGVVITMADDRFLHFYYHGI